MADCDDDAKRQLQTYINSYDTKWYNPKTKLEDWSENDWIKRLVTCINASFSDLSAEFTGLDGLDFDAF